MIEDRVLEKQEQSSKATSAICLISKSRPTIFLTSCKAESVIFIKGDLQSGYPRKK